MFVLWIARIQVARHGKPRKKIKPEVYLLYNTKWIHMRCGRTRIVESENRFIIHPNGLFFRCQDRIRRNAKFRIRLWTNWGRIRTLQIVVGEITCFEGTHQRFMQKVGTIELGAAMQGDIGIRRMEILGFLRTFRRVVYKKLEQAEVSKVTGWSHIILSEWDPMLVFCNQVCFWALTWIGIFVTGIFISSTILYRQHMWKVDSMCTARKATQPLSTSGYFARQSPSLTIIFNYHIYWDSKRAFRPGLQADFSSIANLYCLALSISPAFLWILPNHLWYHSEICASSYSESYRGCLYKSVVKVQVLLSFTKASSSHESTLFISLHLGFWSWLRSGGRWRIVLRWQLCSLLKNRFNYWWRYQVHVQSSWGVQMPERLLGSYALCHRKPLRVSFFDLCRVHWTNYV